MHTHIGDILLVYHDTTPLGYARVEDISADVKPGWWLLSLLLLKLPMQYATWILREEYIEGQPFSMGGKMTHLERLPRPNTPHLLDADVAEDDVHDVAKDDQPDTGCKVIALHSRKKKTSGNDTA